MASVCICGGTRARRSVRFTTRGQRFAGSSRTIPCPSPRCRRVRFALWRGLVRGLIRASLRVRRREDLIRLKRRRDRVLKRGIELLPCRSHGAIRSIVGARAVIEQRQAGHAGRTSDVSIASTRRDGQALAHEPVVGAGQIIPICQLFTLPHIICRRRQDLRRRRRSGTACDQSENQYPSVNGQLHIH